MKRKLKRRAFTIGSLATAAMGFVGCHAAATRRTNPVSSQAPPVGTLPERILGKTEVAVPILGLGGAGKTPLSWPGSEKRAIPLIQRALELGIRYFDTAAPNLLIWIS